MIEYCTTIQQLADAANQAARRFNVLADVIKDHRKQWLCEGEGQWPDKFTLLNRHVRTDLEPPFIFND